MASIYPDYVYYPPYTACYDKRELLGKRHQIQELVNVSQYLVAYVK